MFDNIKKMQELKQMQNAFKAERETVQKKGISVTVNGNMEIENITLNPAIDLNETAVVVRECINDANKNLQKRLAKIMMAQGGGFGGF